MRIEGEYGVMPKESTNRLKHWELGTGEHLGRGGDTGEQDDKGVGLKSM